jgi:hypothetical protein
MENPGETKTPTTVLDPPAPASTEIQGVRLTRSHLVSFCAAGLFICFFLPWISFWLGKPSGYDFAKGGGNAPLLWAIPILSAVTVFAGLAKKGAKLMGYITGVMPFVVLGYSLYHEGSDLLRALAIGAYLGLTLGLVLIILPFRMK